MPAYVVEVIRLAVWLALLAAIFVPLERLFAVERQRIFRKQFVVDLGYFFLNGLVPSAIAAVTLAIIAVTTHRFVPWTLLQATGSLPFWPKLGISLLVAETGFYWGHRLSHEIPFLWRFHAIHHSAEELDCVRKAGQLCKNAMDAMAARAAPGVKERISAARIVLEKTDHAERVLRIMQDFGADAALYATHRPWG